MIVMIMGQENRVDGRQGIERDAGRDPALGPQQREWPGAVAPDRIGEQVDAVQLDQKARMPHPRDDHVWRHNARRMRWYGLAKLCGTRIGDGRTNDPVPEHPASNSTGAHGDSAWPRIAEAPPGTW